MARYIDADELKKRAYPFPCAIGVEYAVSIRQINEQPTADVVEVVRCKDCKHFMEYSEEYHRKVERADGDCYLRFMCSSSIDEQFNAVCCNDFCSYGKRKKVE